MQLDFHDLRTNSGPALLRALKQIETAMTAQEARLSQAETDIADLQYLLSEELIARLAPRYPRLRTRQREIVAELGGGWQIVRQPNDTQGTITMAGADLVSDDSIGTPGVSWLHSGLTREQYEQRGKA